jgi:hypothetical protein
MTMAAFLLFLTLGLALLIFGTFRARSHWRDDLEPYGRYTPQISLLLHPERFVGASAAGSVKRLYAAGAVCLALAAASVLYDIALVTMAR